MSRMNFKDTSLLLLRLVIVAIFLYHGIPKLMDPGQTSQFFSTLGLPGLTGLLVGLIEVAAGLLLLVGFWYTWANYALALIIAGALVLVHIPSFITSGKIGAGLERDFLILFATLVIAAHGPGHFAWKKRKKS